MIARAVVCAAIAACAPAAVAQDLQWHGYLDLRVVAPPREDAWADGGMAKTRFGRGDHAGASAALAMTWQPTPALLAALELQAMPDQRTELDVLHAYLRYRPVSTSRWRYSAKLGAFHPPISLENEGIGWTSLWTLTPSAINSWIGEELRIVGLETSLEHRGDAGTLTVSAAAYGMNDPAGELLAARGWALGDVTSGLDAVLREPDVHAPRARAPVPVLFRPFDEFDDRLGWYAGVDWMSASGRRLRALYYDNRTDDTLSEPYAGRNVFGWRTRFWSFGAAAPFGELTLMAQAMTGDTSFEPGGRERVTEFNAGYVLAAWERGDWQPALRVDLFQTRQTPGPSLLSEHGNALTLALNWRPIDRLRITLEWLRVDSARAQRELAGLPARQIDRQLQANVRMLF